MWNNNLNRRNMLKYLGGTLALPMLESAANSKKETKAPKRVLFISFAYGMMREWYPKDSGKNYTFTEGMMPLKKHRNDFSLLGNLSNMNVFHPHRACSTFLTGANTRATPGVEFKNSVSCDYLISEKVGVETRFSSLPLNAKNNGNWGPGLSLSWGHGGRQIQGINGPLRLYQRMFGGGDFTLEQRTALLAERKSILDTVLVDAKSLNNKITKSDKEKVQSYFESVRDIEKMLYKEEQWLNKPLPTTKLPVPNDGLNGVEETETMFDLIQAAFQADLTRVATYRINAGDISKAIKAKVTGIHAVSHYGSRTRDSALARDKALCALLSSLLDKFKKAKDIDGKSLFDNTLIVFGNEIRTGHVTSDVPLIVAGNGGGGIRHQGHVLYESQKTPLSNLWVSILNHMGLPVDKFSDSDGRIEEIFS